MVAILVAIGAAVGRFAAADEIDGGGRQPRIIAVGVLPDTAGLRRGDNDPAAAVPAATRLGGLSDLCIAMSCRADPKPDAGDVEAISLWAITDRGPNGIVQTAAGKRRTLLEPDFVPSLVRLELREVGRSDAPAVAAEPRRLTVAVAEVVPLAGRSGRLMSGRANGIGADPELLDAGGGAPIPPDPDGVDTEGVVQLPDGSFWLVEEYRPSLLRVREDGWCQERLVPAGTRIPGCDATVHDRLPGRLAGRQDNRGFEAIAAAPDGSRLFCLLQSPLAADEQPGKLGGTVPLLAYDAAADSVVADLDYPLDRDTVDGKLCAMSAVDDETLLVLEHSQTGRTRLHAVGLEPAVPGERIVSKRLVADLTPLLARMGHDVHGRPDDGRDLKLEGMAILADRQIALVNDNDFGVAAATGERPRSCVWIVELPAGLDRGP